MKKLKCRMNTLALFALLMGVGTPGDAQFLGGFFSQQSEKEQLMVAQITGYQTGIRAIRTGYDIAANGLHTIGRLKGDTFKLHNSYLASLSQISPVLQRDPKGKAISAAYRQMVALCSQEQDWQQQQKLLTAGEQRELRSVCENLLEKCRLDLDEAARILTPGMLKMTDAERLAALDRLCRSVQDKQAFAGAFTSKCHTLALSRRQRGRDRATLRSLYGIH